MSWHDTPVLTGRWVRLVPLGQHHAAGLLAAAEDPEVFRWNLQPPPTTAAEATAYVTRTLADPDRLTWAQLDLRGPEPVVAGVTSYVHPDPATRSVEIGATWLGRRFWRTPINTEAKFLLLSRAFEDLGAVRVGWRTDEFNERSQAAIARLGARREALLRKDRRRKDGSWRTSVLYSMTDDDWPGARRLLAGRMEDR
ncbi:GNAT family N-acetyltransferase [Fodinicola acaciae]|uniref:GNAT family N-acetyltransferase n=1 Tax=Fodinicola acaciae TaxID=2681555 RepID=UPI0013D50E4A|nr:GNAT family protein [Fodinicola acaciae]